MGLQLVYDLELYTSVTPHVRYLVTKDGKVWQEYDEKVSEDWTRERIRKDLIDWQDTWRSSEFEVQRILTVTAVQVVK